VINVIGARSLLVVTVALASVAVVFGNVPLVVGKVVMVTVKVVVMVMVWVPEPWDQGFVPQCASRFKTLGVRRSSGTTRARVDGIRGKKTRDFMMTVEKMRIWIEAEMMGGEAM
jgi:hypothetical protein